jgi:hypothetical protein
VRRWAFALPLLFCADFGGMVFIFLIKTCEIVRVRE